MTVVVSSLLISVAVVCTFLHVVVKRRFRGLEKGLPVAYQRAIAAPPLDDNAPRLIALSIDLMRKRHCNVALDALTLAERRLALHAYAIETQPHWVNWYARMWLRPSERALMQQLHHIKMSRPEKPVQHFGAVRKEQALRRTNAALRS